MTQITDKLIAVYISDNAYDIQIWNHGIGFKHDNYKGETDTNGFYHIHTGLGRWCDYKIVATLQNISDEECERFVEREDSADKERGYWDYSHINRKWYKFAKNSLISLLKSKGMDTTKNILLIELK